MSVLNEQDYKKAVELRDKGANFVWRSAKGARFATENAPLFCGVPTFSLRSVVLGVERGYFEFLQEEEMISLGEEIQRYEWANNSSRAEAEELGIQTQIFLTGTDPNYKHLISKEDSPRAKGDVQSEKQ